MTIMQGRMSIPNVVMLSVILTVAHIGNLKKRLGWGLLQAFLLGGLGDLVTTYNWACNPTSNLPNWPSRGYPN